MIQSFHVHVYYDQPTFNLAERICKQVSRQFEVPMGYMHKKPVGPHPMWSCQLTVSQEKLTNVLSWLMIHREGLIVFFHGDTGDDLADHTKHVGWLGESKVLNLEMFRDPLRS